MSTHDLLMQTISSWIDRFDPEHDPKHFDLVMRGSRDLVLCLGDSWTFGNSLPPEQRQDLIYGAQVAQELGADLVNVGMCGYSNSTVLHFGEYLLQQVDLDQLYENIWLVITLTENGRDTESPFGFEFDYIRYFHENGTHCSVYENLLDIMEQSWYRRINHMAQRLPRAKIFVGQNFVWHPGYVDIASDRIRVSHDNWIEQIAQQGGLDRPSRARLVTGWVIEKFGLCNVIGQVSQLEAWQEFCLPLMDQALMVNQWLDHSPFNHEGSSKHPNHEGHQFWKNHVMEVIAA